MVKILDAGADQFGGEADPAMLVLLVESGKVSEGRIDESARRLLKEKFVLGLFDEARYVDVERAGKLVGNPEFVEAGLAAQRRSVTLLTNPGQTLPLPRGMKLYVEGIRPEALTDYGTVVGSPEEADFAILRVDAPFEERPTIFENFFHSGSLDFPEEKIEHFKSVASSVPTVMDVFLDRPAILTPFAEDLAALTGTFGCSDEAYLQVVFGEYEPGGKLPFDIPRSMAAVEAANPDVPFDTKDPLFQFGHGLTYQSVNLPR